MRLEHKAGVDIIYELAVRLYPSPLESYREAISNALDEGSRKIEIQNSIKEIIVEDYGEGIKDIEDFRMFGQAAKAGLGGEIIGEKGLGKLSLLRLANNVVFRSNNGEIGYNIMMTPQYFDCDMKSANKFLNHLGTQVIIENPKDVPPIDELSSYLKKTFGLRIAKGAEIILNGVKLQSKSKIDAKEDLLFRLKGGFDATGNIKQDKKGRGTLDLYIKHVFVSTILVDPERKFSGWVNCNLLTPTTSRNDVVRNEQFLNFLDHLKQYVTKFPKIEEEIGLDEKLIGNELNKLLKNYLEDMKIFPQGKVMQGRGNQLGELDNQNQLVGSESIRKGKKMPINGDSDYLTIHSKPKTNKPIKRTVKTDYGIMWVDQDYGNEKEPIFYVEPNIMVRNRTNDLYKFALKNKNGLGPKWLRLIPYLSRVVISINPKNATLNNEDRNLAIDSATRYFLKQKQEL